MSNGPLPIIIQGGMGAGVSGWRLARAVSRAGQLGVVSGTALDVILARRLQLGDPGGHVRRALGHFPVKAAARRVLDRHFIPGGKAESEPFRLHQIFSERPNRQCEELLVMGSFVEVFLAKENHSNPVGINYLEKIQLPTLPSLLGAMLAGVSWVLMGAGIPRTIPGVLDHLAAGEPVELRLNVAGAACEEEHFTRFDPRGFLEQGAPDLARPRFVAIVSSATLAGALAKKSNGRVDGFVVEGFTAGGHNAPPRGIQQLADDGQPVYGKRDMPDLAAIRALGLPFWLAGSYARPGRLREALDAGAAGVQIGTAFAYCDESDLSADLKERVLAASGAGRSNAFTDPVASPTGFPFKVVPLEGTLSDDAAYAARTRVCDLGYLRHAHKRSNGMLGWRCPAEPIADYVQKGGTEAETLGRKCICNALLANVGLAQVPLAGQKEKPLVTSGDDVADVARFLKRGANSYSARDVIDQVVHGAEPSHAPDPTRQETPHG
ncbi:MAG: nitronate monooxygenase [Pirellulales bacterium]|nr:nitronate monooxygenase [Pirellulales bacterium]